MTSKRFKALPKNTKSLPAQSIDKLIPIVKKNCTTKFEESIEMSLQINNKQKKTEINLRTIVNLPSGSGKKLKLQLFAKKENLKKLMMQVQISLVEMILLIKLKMDI